MKIILHSKIFYIHLYRCRFETNIKFIQSSQTLIKQVIIKMSIMKKTFIAYYRVSTSKQGESGLGLSAQKQAVKRFINDDTVLLEEFEEVESGKKSDRIELQKAIKKAKETNSKLIIAKLDRLSRNASFIFTLRDSGVDFICADIPDANTLTIGLLAVLAQEEAQRTSDRTKAALKEIKRKIENGQEHISKSGNKVVSLGNSSNLTQEARLKGALSRKQKASNNIEMKKTGEYIKLLVEQGISFYAISKKLNDLNFTTPKGGKFTTIQTQRVYNNLIN